MHVVVTGKNIDVTAALKSYAEEKVRKVEKYLHNVSEAVVMLSCEKYRHIAEVSIKVNGVLIQGKESTEEMYSSIDKVMDKIERQVRKYKEKLSNHKFKGEKRPEPVGEASEAATEEETPKIIKTKRFDIKPMTAEEAVMQMDLQDKNFFVFLSAKDQQVNVIYRRDDGNVGLIETIY
ncbi:MAG: ribosome-associated translation inhibitor RaiA [Nitrospirota bacterium]|nr:ribosome-associated translation inhibitor RaiA [Nitrospirota bacterium]